MATKTNQTTSTTSMATARSLLFVPGDRPDRFAKAAAAGADLVVCDLEDAVAAAHKESARDAVATWLGAGGRAAVRVNGVSSQHFEQDCAALTGCPGLEAVVVPKAEDARALTAMAQRLGARVPVIALIETALGLDHAREIAGCEGVARLAFGSIDFAVDLDCSEDDDALLLARSGLVLASRLAQISPPVDGVSTDLNDGAVAGRDADHARRLGFGGKLCVHPRQVAAVNAAFSPSADEIAWATAVLGAAVLEAGGQGGAVQIGGRMVDQPVLDQARRIIGRAASAAAADGEGA